MNLLIRRTLALPVLLLAVALGAGAGGTLALWSQQETTGSISLTDAVVGLAVSTSEKTSHANEYSPSALFTIGPDEAARLLDNGADAHGEFAVAIPFSVTLLSSLWLGMDYEITMEDLDEATILGLGGATTTFFAVPSPSMCTPAQAANAHPYQMGAQVPGIGVGTKEVQVEVHHWCLVIAVQPDHYENTASASGTDLLGSLQGSNPGIESVWRAWLLPDLGLEPTVTVTVTAVVTSW